MERVWDEERARGSRVLRRSTLAELGGAGAIVRDHLDRALAVLDAEEQDAAARMFEHLVTPSGRKIAHRASDLAQFRTSRAGAGRGRCSARSAASGSCARSTTPRAATATRSSTTCSRGDPRLGPPPRARARANRSRRRQRRLVALAAAACVAASWRRRACTRSSSAATRGPGAARRSERARGRRARELETDPELSLLLASEAAGGSGAANEDVLRARAASRARGVLRGHDGRCRRRRLRAGRIATIDGAGTLRTFPPRTAPALLARRLGPGCDPAAFSADGDVVAVARRQLVRVRRRRRAGGRASSSTPAPGPSRSRGGRGGSERRDGDARRAVTVRAAGPAGSKCARPSRRAARTRRDGERTLAAGAKGAPPAWQVGRAPPDRRR